MTEKAKCSKCGKEVDTSADFVVMCRDCMKKMSPADIMEWVKQNQKKRK